MIIDLRFAMDTYGITFASMLPTTTYLLSTEMGNLLRLLFMDKAVVHQVACWGNKALCNKRSPWMSRRAY